MCKIIWEINAQSSDSPNIFWRIFVHIIHPGMLCSRPVALWGGRRRWGCCFSNFIKFIFFFSYFNSRQVQSCSEILRNHILSLTINKTHFSFRQMGPFLLVFHSASFFSILLKSLFYRYNRQRTSFGTQRHHRRLLRTHNEWKGFLSVGKHLIFWTFWFKERRGKPFDGQGLFCKNSSRFQFQPIRGGFRSDGHLGWIARWEGQREHIPGDLSLSSRESFFSSVWPPTQTKHTPCWCTAQ